MSLNYIRLSVSSIAESLKVLVVENHACIAVTFLGLFDHSIYSDESFPMSQNSDREICSSPASSPVHRT
jgi:hypothetical protein